MNERYLASLARRTGCLRLFIQIIHCFTLVKVKTDKRNMEIKFSAIKLGFIQEQTLRLLCLLLVLIIVVVIAIYLICCIQQNCIYRFSCVIMMVMIIFRGWHTTTIMLFHAFLLDFKSTKPVLLPKYFNRHCSTKSEMRSSWLK